MEGGTRREGQNDMLESLEGGKQPGVEAAQVNDMMKSCKKELKDGILKNAWEGLPWWCSG